MFYNSNQWYHWKVSDNIKDAGMEMSRRYQRVFKGRESAVEQASDDVTTHRRVFKGAESGVE